MEPSKNPMGRPRKPNAGTPLLTGATLQDDDLELAVGSPTWFTWLMTAKRFYVDHPTGSFFCRKERRDNGDYWYANRRVDGRAYHRYVGKSADLTFERIEELATMFNARIADQGTPPVTHGKQRIDLPQLATITTDATMLWMRLIDGRVIGTPIDWFPRLIRGTPEQRANWRLQDGNTGVNWPDLDEDISVRVLMNLPS